MSEILGKIIFVQPLGESDTSAILSISVATFNIDSGTCIDLDIMMVDLEQQQTEEITRDIDLAYLSRLFTGDNTNTFLCKLEGFVPTLPEEICVHLWMTVFSRTVKDACPIYFFESYKSYPVLKSFCRQFSAPGYECILPEKPVDIESYVNTTFSISESSSIYEVCFNLSKRMENERKESAAVEEQSKGISG